MTRKATRWEGQSLDALKARWDRASIQLFSKIDSTSTRAAKLAEEGAPAGTIVLADEQTAGRGTESRRWHSPVGAGLYLAIVFRPKQLPNPALIPLLAGLAVTRAVERVLGGSGVAIKWPNDLIVSDRKAGGVLSEASWSGEEPNYVVVGIGVNVHQRSSDFPPALRDVVVSLDMAAGRRLSRLDLADLVIRGVEERCVDPPDALDREFLREFDEYDWLRDRRCSVQMPDGSSVWGTAVGIAPDGALLYRPDRGALERVTSGRVVVEQLATPDF